jgi:hypothetical protein
MDFLSYSTFEQQQAETKFAGSANGMHGKMHSPVCINAVVESIRFESNERGDLSRRKSF